jgi:ornithine carbamoyltransferase
VKTKHLISIADLSIEETNQLINSAIESKKKKAAPVLAGKTLALLFEKPSLRTRVSFEIAVNDLGGNALYLSPSEVGLGKREPVADVARVLGRYVHGIIARTFTHQTIELLAQYSGVNVINALSDYEHPCQALADIMTIKEKKGTLKGLKLTYIGDGNNVANSLLLAACQTGINFTIASPEGYTIDKNLVTIAREIASKTGSAITLLSDPEKAAADSDIIYTDVWTSMGQETESHKRRIAFTGYQITAKILDLCRKDAIFMHPLPAHYGEEVAEGITNDKRSVVFDQAENRLHAQRALLAELYTGLDSDKQA